MFLPKICKPLLYAISFSNYNKLKYHDLIIPMFLIFH